MGHLAVCPMKTVGGVPLRPFIVYLAEGQHIHESESLVDVANFSAMPRVQLTPMAQEEGYPSDWQDPTDADWTMLGRMLKYMVAPQ